MPVQPEALRLLVLVASAEKIGQPLKSAISLIDLVVSEIVDLTIAGQRARAFTRGESPSPSSWEAIPRSEVEEIHKESLSLSPSELADHSDASAAYIHS